MNGWKREPFLIARLPGPASVLGWTRAGLGIHLYQRNPSIWCVTHLGSGLSICTITAPKFGALQVAREIVEAGDWTFEGPNGWKNRDPSLADRTRAILARHEDLALPTISSVPRSEVAAQARLVAEARLETAA